MLFASIVVPSTWIPRTVDTESLNVWFTVPVWTWNGSGGPELWISERARCGEC